MNMKKRPGQGAPPSISTATSDHSQITSPSPDEARRLVESLLVHLALIESQLAYLDDQRTDWRHRAHMAEAELRIAADAFVMGRNLWRVRWCRPGSKTWSMRIYSNNAERHVAERWHQLRAEGAAVEVSTCSATWWTLLDLGDLDYWTAS